MILVIGEILIDRFVDYERIGGAPFNFASHLKQMGWPVRFLTRIGDDAYGRQILQRLEESGFQSEDVQVDSHHPTGVVEVTLDNQGVPQFEICKGAAYDYLDLSHNPGFDLSAVQMIYFGTLVQRTPQGCRQVQDLLDRINPATCGFCDINLRPPHINPEAIQASLRHADILKLNTEELMHISAMFSGPQDEPEAVEWLMQTCDISQIALTSGSHGSKVITAGRTITSPPVRVDTIVDTVGAGDAYAAVYAAGYLKNLPTHRILELATDFAARICGLPGAVPSGTTPYQTLRQKLEP
jgi:fructokinase